jgi:hypothetical protein
VEISSATILAGRPNGEEQPSFDSVSGGFPTVDLHVVDVPAGSLSRVQLSLQVARYPWLVMAVLAGWLEVAVLIWAGLRLGSSGTRDSPTAAALFVTVTAGLAAILWRPAEHRMAHRLLSLLSGLTALSTLLLFVGGAMFAFEGDRPLRAPLFALAGATAVIAGLISVTWIRTGSSSKAEQISPWEQGRHTDEEEMKGKRIDPARYKTFAVATENYKYDRPAIKVASAEAEVGDEDEYNIDAALHQGLIDLVAPYLAPNRCDAFRHMWSRDVTSAGR